jgi:hypothetical protein
MSPSQTPQARSSQCRLESEVELRTAQLTELTQHLQTVREDERGGLARHLHDELGSLLTSAKLPTRRRRGACTAGRSACAWRPGASGCAWHPAPAWAPAS